jgi:hypothetical protein
MATAITRQRNILEIQKPVEVQVTPRTTHFCPEILILSRDPVPLRCTTCHGGQTRAQLVKVKLKKLPFFTL